MFFNSSGKKSSISDAALIEQFRSSGDLEYLGQLFERYIHLVYGTCLKYLKDREASQDATMQIFEKLISEIPKRDILNFKSWLHVLTKNHCLMQLRSEKSRQAGKEKMMQNEIIFMESDQEMNLNNESLLDRDLEVLKKCIDQLKDEQKECIKLFYLEEKCYQEIAESTRFELKKVKSYIQNGKRNLKICMDQHG